MKVTRDYKYSQDRLLILIVSSSEMMLALPFGKVLSIR